MYVFHFSLAISDFLLLLSGVPQEVYSIWYKYPYVFGEIFCVARGLIAETSANATVLTITSFTVERYLAICHPFLQHTMSKLSRAVRLILIVWLVSIGLAIPQALQFGVVTDHNRVDHCAIKRVIIVHSFELSSVLFFLTPMTLITILYILIGLKLRASGIIKHENGASLQQRVHVHSKCRQQTSLGTRRVLKMLGKYYTLMLPIQAQSYMSWIKNDAIKMQRKQKKKYRTQRKEYLHRWSNKIWLAQNHFFRFTYFFSIVCESTFFWKKKIINDLHYTVYTSNANIQCTS